MAVIEQRYAQALVDLVAKGAIPAETLRHELRDLAAMVEASPELRTVVASPALAWDQKSALLDALAAKMGLSPLTRNFLLVTAQRGRMGRIGGMDEAFEQSLLDQQGIVKAEVVSARALNGAECAAIEKELAARLGRKPQAHYRTDPALVGGFIARVGDQVYDGSIRGRLQRLRQAIRS